MTDFSIILLVGMFIPLLLLALLIGYFFRQKLASGSDAARPTKISILWIIGAISLPILWFVFDRGLLLGVGVLVALSILAIKGKGGVWAKAGIVVLGLSLLLLGEKSLEVLKKVQTATSGVILEDKPIIRETASPKRSSAPRPTTAPSSQPQQELIHKGEAKWKKQTDDRTIPVGEWSEAVEVPPRCGITFTGGYGVVYVVEFDYYNTGRKALKHGEHQNMSVFWFKMLEPGHTALPYTLECKAKPY